MSETTVDDPTRSKHILVVGSDYVDYREHMDLDTVVQKCLNESENERLKNPITPDDYLALFKLIVENTPHHIVYKMVEEHVETVKIKFLDPGVESSEWKEFTRMLDMCLKRGRYRAVRVMWHFYLVDAKYNLVYKENLKWEYATKYLVNGKPQD